MGREWTWSRKSSRKLQGFCREEEEEEATAYSSGCLSSISQIFHFHPTPYALSRHRRPPFPTGVEAPRNSLDLEELPLPPWITEDKESLHLPMGMKIKTRLSTKNSKDCSNIDSPSSKTPNLVARLMGLDLLPQSSSPSSSSSATFSNQNSFNHGCKHQEKLHGRQRIFLNPENIPSSRSLPETPRASVTRKSNLEFHHRLSLQDEDRQSGFWRKDDLMMMNDENMSPNENRKQILRQIKENVSRKAGFDITNTIKNVDLRFMELKNSKKQTRKGAVKPRTRESHGNAEKVRDNHDHTKFISRKKKVQIEEPCLRSSKAAKAINKHCRKPPLTNHLLSFDNVVNLRSSTMKPPKKQTSNVQESKHKSQLSGSSSQIHRQKHTEVNDKKDIETSSKPATNSTSAPNNGRSELEYVSRILSRTFFSNDNQEHVETSTAISGNRNGQPLCYSDRKLLSDLTDELLGETLNEEKFRKNYGLLIIPTILQRMKIFPRAKCEVLEDLDRLIEQDLGKSKLESGLKMAIREEIVREIEKEMMERLVHEATSLMAFCLSVHY